jgi:hypothetical protein
MGTTGSGPLPRDAEDAGSLSLADAGAGVGRGGIDTTGSGPPVDADGAGGRSLSTCTHNPTHFHTRQTHGMKKGQRKVRRVGRVREGLH